MQGNYRHLLRKQQSQIPESFAFDTWFPENLIKKKQTTMCLGFFPTSYEEQRELG